MKFRSAVLQPALSHCHGWFPCRVHIPKWRPTFRLLTGLLPAILVSTAVAQVPKYIPAFQFAIFYNINLEMDPGSAMVVNGPVFSNQGIWAGTANLTFNSTVAAVGQVNVTSIDPFMTGKNDSLAPPHFTLAGQPISGADPLYLRVGAGVAITNAEAMLNLPPAAYAMGTAAAYTTNGLAYNFNACDLIISNSSVGVNGFYGTNITITFQDTGAPYLYTLTNGEICTFRKTNGPASLPAYWTTNSQFRPTTNYAYPRVAASFSFVTNVSFYDYREMKTVQAVEIDIAKFNNWLTNRSYAGAAWNALCSLGSQKNHPIDSICIYNSVPLTSTNLPAVRIINGQKLFSSYGLTISTPQPLYVYGDLNTTTNGTVFSKALGDTKNTRPCGLMADAITILSSNWTDTYASSLAVGSRIPAATCINAATLEGTVQSTNGHYSGGVENFLRLLEAWSSSIPLTYNGSIVVMFPSIYATNYWSGGYYGVPKRNLGFDTNFVNTNWLPPLTPLLVASNPPVILVPPTSQIVFSGQTVVFSVTAFSFMPLGYQWSLNGTTLEGATNVSLMLTNVQLSQAGDYAVLVTNDFGSTQSSNAVLTVTESPPIIQAQPTNQAVYVNGTATFNIAATGSLPFTYQWFFNETEIDGATNASFTLTQVQFSQAGNYAALVGNALGSAPSSNALLTVNPPPPCTPVASDLVDWWPAEGNADDVMGSNHGMLVGGAGFVAGEVGQAFAFDGISDYVSIPNSASLDSFTTNITIELWLKSGQLTANSDWKGIVTKGNSSWRLQATSGAKTVAFSASGVSPNGDLSGTRNVNDGQWHHVAAVYDGSNMYIYVDGTLDVSQPATGTISQNNDPMCIGANSKAYVVSCHCNELGYFFNGLVDEVSIYHRALSASEIQAIYLAGPEGKCHLLSPFITLQPANQIAFVGGMANFSVVADGSSPLLYQWQRNGANLIDATNATLTLNNISLDQAGNYSVTITNLAGSIASSDVVLSVYSTVAATLGAVSFSGDNAFHFQVAGVSGFNYNVQVSTNLIDWVSLITNTAPFNFNDSNTVGFPRMFYRAIYSP